MSKNSWKKLIYFYQINKKKHEILLNIENLQKMS
jgi:hypothetical protein